MIFVNYKTYEEGSGQKAVTLTKVLEEVARESLEVWVQHVDPLSYGAHTGWTLPEEVARIGISGVFLNHSEHKFDNFDALYTACEKAIASNLKTLVFAGSLDELTKVSELGTTYVAYEPPELIGSTTTSVTQAQPEIISKAADIARSKGLPLVVGAGVHSMADVKKSLELGAVGVAVATDIVKSEDPRRELMDLVEGFK